MINEKYFDETEKSIHDLMDRFTNDVSISDQDWRNFEALKKINFELATKLSSTEYNPRKVSDFLENFIYEFDNTYADKLPEAIIIALKQGKRTGLTLEWNKGYKGLGKWEWDPAAGPDPTKFQITEDNRHNNNGGGTTRQ